MDEDNEPPLELVVFFFVAFVADEAFVTPVMLVRIAMRARKLVARRRFFCGVLRGRPERRFFCSPTPMVSSLAMLGMDTFGAVETSAPTEILLCVH